MAELVWWGVVTLISVCFGYYLGGIKGLVFMAIVCIIGGGFMLFERKTHSEQR